MSLVKNGVQAAAASEFGRWGWRIRAIDSSIASCHWQCAVACILPYNLHPRMCKHRSPLAIAPQLLLRFNAHVQSISGATIPMEFKFTKRYMQGYCTTSEAKEAEGGRWIGATGPQGKLSLLPSSPKRRRCPVKHRRNMLGTTDTSDACILSFITIVDFRRLKR